MTGPTTHDAYLAALPADQRAALETLAARLEVRLPGAVACISYAMPAYRVKDGHGKPKVIAGFAAFKRHLGLYPFSGSVVPQIADRLAAEGFTTSKSGVLFTSAQPVPDWALDEMLRLRRAEIG